MWVAFVSATSKKSKCRVQGERWLSLPWDSYTRSVLCFLGPSLCSFFLLELGHPSESIFELLIRYFPESTRDQWALFCVWFLNRVSIRVNPHDLLSSNLILFNVAGSILFKHWHWHRHNIFGIWLVLALLVLGQDQDHAGLTRIGQEGCNIDSCQCWLKLGYITRQLTASSYISIHASVELYVMFVGWIKNFSSIRNMQAWLISSIKKVKLYRN